MFGGLEIRDFTVFRRAKFDFVPGINVLVGANATGKTHVLKMLYTVHAYQNERPDGGDTGPPFRAVFAAEESADLVRRGAESTGALVTLVWNGTWCEVLIPQFGPMSSPDYAIPEWKDVTRPVFIPVKDMLAHSVGFVSLYDRREIDFDMTHREILALAFTPRLRPGALDSSAAAMLDPLSDQIGGRVEVQGERFYLVGESGKLDMHLVAEGWRKLALLYVLIANGSLAPGAVLYWDEPETNLNPSLMDEVVDVLLDLSRQGVQVFVTTHDYIILKELDLRRTEADSLRFFALERKKDSSVTVHPSEEYSGLRPNLIAEQFRSIYTMQVKRSLGGRDAR